MLTDTIPTPGWWLLDRGRCRFAQPFNNPEYISQEVYSDGSIGAVVLGQARIVGYTHDPEAVLAWVRDGTLP